MTAQANTHFRAQLPSPARSNDGNSADRVTQALEEYAASVEAGQPLSRELLLHKYSDVADELEGCLDSLAFIREVAPQLADQSFLGATAGLPSSASALHGSPDQSVVRGSPDPAHPIRHGESPAATSSIEHPTSATLGDFRILRELGRGGMGVVYEAEQLSLGRRVALKVLPFAAMLETRRLERFRHEAQAAAMLRHPHIVTVYSVGCERGVHYYAMDYIEGPSLAEVIEQQRASGEERGTRSEQSESAISNPQSPAPIPHSDTRPIAALSTLKTTQPREFFRSVAQLGIQAAEVLDYAHQMGVVHRDIKPSNLLLECSHLAPRDEASKIHHAERDGYTPKLWIADFGLAMTQSDAGLTMTGDLLGTLRYMSPEQAAGKRLPLDHRTDVYSLGITLYELLAGQPAFNSTDRAELLRKIADVDPPPLRKIVPTVPADPETIIRKAMEKDAVDRYGTAGELAADLRRFIEHRPIVARPPSLVSRTRKWARRNSSVVAAAIGVLLLAVVGLSVGALMLSAQKRESEANLRIAAEAVDQLLAEMGKEAGVYGQLPQAERILDQAAQFYERLIKKSADPAVLRRAATAHNHIGSLYQTLGRHELAIEKHHAALALLGRIDQAENPADILVTRATAHDGIGKAHSNRLYAPYAEPHFDQARAIWQQLVDDDPHNVSYLDGLTGTLNSLAVIYMNDERLEESEATYRQISELNKRLPPQRREAPDHLNTMAGINCNLGTLAVEKGILSAAEPQFREAIATQQQVIALEPGVQQHQHDLYNFQWNLADLLVRQGKHTDASAAAEKLVERFPNRLQAYYEAADLLLRCAEITDTTTLPLPLGEGRGEGLPREGQSNNPPLPPGEGRGEGLPEEGRGEGLRADGGSEGLRYRAAAGRFIATADQATERTSDSLERFAWFLVMCRDKSFRDPARALALADAGLADAPQRAALHRIRGIALYRLGQYQPAIDAFEQSAAILPGNEIDDGLFLAMSYWQLGNKKEAKEWYATSLNWFANHELKRPSVYDFLATARREILAEANEVLGADMPTATRAD